MDKLKNFISKKKVDRHFKHTGKGATLAGSVKGTASAQEAQSSSPADRIHASDVAAQAAIKRLYTQQPEVSSSQKKIQMLAARELEKERREREGEGKKFMEEIKNLTVQEPEKREFEHSNVIDSVKFTCEFLGEEEMTKEEIRHELEGVLREQLAEEGVVSAALMIESLNKHEERKAAKEIIHKYIQNVVEHPDEAKFRRIRLSNKVFKEKVQPIIGSFEYLQAVGFELASEPLNPGEAEEQFLVMPEGRAQDTGELIQALEVLDEATPIPLKVARDTKVFVLKKGERITSPKLPTDFFALTAEEVKREQDARSVQVDRLTTMRTREMRAKDETLRQYQYKYTLMRVRTGDDHLLQGVFGVHEPLGNVRQWVAAHLASQFNQFSLNDPAKATAFNDSKSLAELGLVPAATLHLDIRENPVPCLNPEHTKDALPFSLT